MGFTDDLRGAPDDVRNAMRDAEDSLERTAEERPALRYALDLRIVLISVAGALVVALILRLLGLSSPDFPGTRGRARAVMGVSTLLVAGTVGAAIATASKPKHEAAAAKGGAAAPAKGGAAGSTVTLAADPGGQLRFDTKSLTAK